MTDYYGGSAGSNIEGLGEMQGETPTGVYTDYKLRTPDRAILSAAFIMGQSGLISVDKKFPKFAGLNYRGLSPLLCY